VNLEQYRLRGFVDSDVPRAETATRTDLDPRWRAGNYIPTLVL